MGILMVAMVGVAAIIIDGDDLGHTCLGPHADHFAQSYLSTMMITMELVFVGCLEKYVGEIDRCDDHDGKTKRGAWPIARWCFPVLKYS